MDIKLNIKDVELSKSSCAIGEVILLRVTVTQSIIDLIKSGEVLVGRYKVGERITIERNFIN